MYIQLNKYFFWRLNLRDLCDLITQRSKIIPNELFVLIFYAYYMGRYIIIYISMYIFLIFFNYLL